MSGNGISFFFDIIFISFCMFVLFPVLACLFCVWKKAWFRSRQRVLAALIFYTAFSWLFINAAVWIPYSMGLTEIRGPEAAFALVFGGLYLWVTSLPVFLIYAVWTAIRAVTGRIRTRKTSRGEAEENMPQ